MVKIVPNTNILTIVSANAPRVGSSKKDLKKKLKEN